jgi:hypothetical protein
LEGGTEGRKYKDTGEILHGEELHDFYSSPNIIRVIKSRIRWVGCVVCTGDIRNACNILVRNQ